MLKIPAFLNFLLISYLIYAIICLFQMIILGVNVPDNNTITESSDYLSTASFKYFILSLSFSLTILLFFTLIDLKILGWVLQLSFSLYYIFLAINSLFNKVGLEFLLEVTWPLPGYTLLPWGVYNAYIIYYFFTPEIIQLFISRFKAQEVKNKELVSLLHSSKDFIEAYKRSKSLAQTHTKIPASNYKYKAIPKEQTKYLPTAKILLTQPKSIAELNEIKDLNKLIERKARQIITMLSRILPELKEKEIIDINTYNYYKRFEWSIEDIIKDFSLRAVSHCPDKRNLGDKFLKYTKKVDEFELLSHTNRLMDSWLNETGNEIGNLIQLEAF